MSYLDVVAGILDEHGRTMTHVRAASGGTYDPATGSITGGTGFTSTLRGVFIDYNAREIDGTTVQVGDRKLLVKAEGLANAPKIDDIVDGAVKIVAPVRTFQSGTTVLAYTCNVRGQT